MRKKFIVCALSALLLLMAAFAEPVSEERSEAIRQRLEALGWFTAYEDGGEGSVEAAVSAFLQGNGLPESDALNDAAFAVLMSDTALSRQDVLTARADAYTNRALLQNGSSGEETLSLQTRLTELGYYSANCDGIFGSLTERAVRLFQLSCGLDRTGIADRSTLLHLYEGSPLSWSDYVDSMCVAPGGSPAKVRVLQRMLKSLGYFSGTCSGSFGEETTAAIYNYQSEHSLEQTGLLDHDTVDCIILEDTEGFSPTDQTYLENRALYDRLKQLGYILCEEEALQTGALENGLRLFRLLTGCEDDTAAREFIMTDDAPSPETISANRLMQITVEDASLGARIAQTARAGLGRPVDVHDCNDYAGFCYVQRVLLENGLPVAIPQDLLAIRRIAIEDPAETQPGDLIVFSRSESDWTKLTFAVCTQPGFVAYATNESTYLIEQSIDSLATGEVSRWTPGVPYV